MPVSLNDTQVVFNDATTQTTSAVTAVNVSTGLSSTGGKTPTLTNTGVTSIVAGTGISISGGTGAVTITNSQPGVVSSVNGQTGAIVNTNVDAIGSYILALVGVNLGSTQTIEYAVNSTIAGSNLRYGVTLGLNLYQRSGASYNTYNGGGTAVSGTWRAMGRGQANSSFDAGASQWSPTLWVRIS
jgi:hypothetical protein